jgi:hypothetical protein
VNSDWVKEAPFAVTVCDVKGIILEMNDRSALTFEKDGGRALIGQNLFDCHPEPSRTKVAELLKDGKSNLYTIEKNGVRKLICQTPWYQSGKYAGLVELSIELPAEMPHFIRK